MSKTPKNTIVWVTLLVGMGLGGLVLVFVLAAPRYSRPRTGQAVVEVEMIETMQGDDSRKKERLTLSICQTCDEKKVAALERITQRADIAESTRNLAYRMAADVVGAGSVGGNDEWQCQLRCRFVRTLMLDPLKNHILTPFHIIKVCGAYGGSRERAILLQFIKEGPSPFGKIALESFARLRALPDTPFLLSLVAANVGWSRDPALEALGLSFYSKVTFDRIFEVYRQSDEVELKLAIIRFLGQNPVPDGLRFLEELEAEESGIKRLAARRWLYRARRALDEREKTSIAQVARSLVLDPKTPKAVFRDFFGVDVPPDSVARESWLEGRAPVCGRLFAIQKLCEYVLVNNDLASTQFIASARLGVRERDGALYAVARQMIEKNQPIDIRYWGAVRLAEMGCFDGVPALIDVARSTWHDDLDRNRDVGAWAMMSLTQITGENYLDDTKAWQAWWEASGREALKEWTYSFEDAD